VRNWSAAKYLDHAGSGALRFTPSHSIAAIFLLDPYYVAHPITNGAAIQPHRSEYLRSLPTLKGFNRDLPPTSKFTPCQQRATSAPRLIKPGLKSTQNLRALSAVKLANDVGAYLQRMQEVLARKIFQANQTTNFSTALSHR
jgi:hypothetical protein